MTDNELVSQDLLPHVQVGVYEPSPFKVHRCLSGHIAHRVLVQKLLRRACPRGLPACLGPDPPWRRCFFFQERRSGDAGMKTERHAQLAHLVPRAKARLDERASA
eukprot:3345866-Pyramimonas_sp.AAC.1